MPGENKCADVGMRGHLGNCDLRAPGLGRNGGGVKGFGRWCFKNDLDTGWSTSGHQNKVSEGILDGLERGESLLVQSAWILPRRTYAA